MIGDSSSLRKSMVEIHHAKTEIENLHLRLLMGTGHYPCPTQWNVDDDNDDDNDDDDNGNQSESGSEISITPCAMDFAHKLLNEDTRSMPPLDGNPSGRHFPMF